LQSRYKSNVCHAFEIQILDLNNSLFIHKMLSTSLLSFVCLLTLLGWSSVALADDGELFYERCQALSEVSNELRHENVDPKLLEETLAKCRDIEERRRAADDEFDYGTLA